MTTTKGRTVKRLTLLVGLMLAGPLLGQAAPPDAAAKPYDKWLPRLGFNRGLAQKFARTFEAPEAVVKALPAKVSLRSQMFPPLDQGQIGSCAENAFAQAFRVTLKQA